MKRLAAGPVAMSMALGMMADMMEPSRARRVKPLPNTPDYRTSSKTWTCKRCGSNFHPHRSPTICDDCHRAKYAEKKRCEHCSTWTHDVRLMKHIPTDAGWIELTRYFDLCPDCVAKMTHEVNVAIAATAGQQGATE
jgi:hypothetical protein